MKKQFSLMKSIILVLLFLTLSSCADSNTSNNPSTFVGRWQVETGEFSWECVHGQINVSEGQIIEFFSNGIVRKETGSNAGNRSSWHVESRNNRLLFYSLSRSVAHTFTISQGRLVLNERIILVRI